MGVESFGFLNFKKKSEKNIPPFFKSLFTFLSLNDQNYFYFHPAVQKPSLVLLHPQAPLAIGSFDVKEKSLSK
jgi:hypothetical protein